ncbi:membrane-bound lytic murein transglycosylase MltF [Kushneria aurantia]|uniref:Membrane-bound lytic murein transglycosylase MltF n=1 Tax=Kushneria aurantia TaxID=504092 RepID=A0ABV6G2B0_9GAMM|nr:membrane-bound lytic murein transglycosylase MltF [Kushneria aurantia]
MKYCLGRPRPSAVLLLSALIALAMPARLPLGIAGPLVSGGQLAEVQARDFLEVATRNAPSTFYEGQRGPGGFEFELFSRFADSLGVSLAVDDEHRSSEVLDRVASGGADIGAAGLVLDRRRSDLIYSRPIMSMQPLVIYRRGMAAPSEIADLDNLDVGIATHNGISRTLRELQPQHPTLSWRESPGVEATDLLAMVQRGELDAAVVYAHEFRINRLFFREVEPAFEIGEPLSLSWAIQGDLALLERANDFIATMRTSGELKALAQQYFGQDDYLEYVGTRRFLEQIEQHLDRWRAPFKRAAAENDFDWQLLAAVGYQESHWRPDAVSPTGVRGMMMLTRDTARFMEIEDREDPLQSIDGSARYLRYLHGRIPDSVTEPDRTWMTLAAYNLGLGHLLDARELARQRNLDPDQWQDVRNTLPLLQEQRWYRRVEHGFARGSVAALYVRNVRRYEEILNYVHRSQRRFPSLVRATANNRVTPAFEVIAPAP